MRTLNAFSSASRMQNIGGWYFHAKSNSVNEELEHRKDNKLYEENTHKELRKMFRWSKAQTVK
jgi:hypothetical protein